MEKVIAEALATIFKTKGYMLRMVEAKDRSLESLINLKYSYPGPGLPAFELFIWKRNNFYSHRCFYSQSLSLAVNKTPDIVYLFLNGT